MPLRRRKFNFRAMFVFPSIGRTVIPVTKYMGETSRRQSARASGIAGFSLWLTISFLQLPVFAILSSEKIYEFPLVPSGATVVLMAGLPGDIESENAYREQMQELLGALSARNVHHVISASDFSESLKSPDKLEVTFLKADRNSFQSLGTTLSGLTNSVVVIVWGHGGKQGSTPVFHVRGPRLTPADFGELAAGFRGPVSRWLLMFRGSGAFARQLAGEHREILSSECETTFASDPIGASLLLKLARSAPDSSFDRLAQNFGRAIGGWYEERHLARTEDPALWVGTEKPRRLLDTDTGGSFPSAEQGANQLTTAVQKLTTEEPQKATTVSADLSVAWNEIKKVQP